MPKRIMIVDDDLDIVNLITEILTSNGYETLHAYTGDETLRKLYETQVDMVLLDVMLPGEFDGWRTLMEIKKLSPYRNVPVIMITAKQPSFDML
ncbi:MAG: response regulator [Methermicoccaceae archaeon]